MGEVALLAVSLCAALKERVLGPVLVVLARVASKICNKREGVGMTLGLGAIRESMLCESNAM